MNTWQPAAPDFLDREEVTRRLNAVELAAYRSVKWRGRSVAVMLCAILLASTVAIVFVLPRDYGLPVGFTGLVIAGLAFGWLWEWIETRARHAGEVAREANFGAVSIELIAARILPYTQSTTDPAAWATTTARYLVQRDCPEGERDSLTRASETLCQYFAQRAFECEVRGSPPATPHAQRAVKALIEIQGIQNRRQSPGDPLN